MIWMGLAVPPPRRQRGTAPAVVVERRNYWLYYWASLGRRAASRAARVHPQGLRLSYQTHVG